MKKLLHILCVLVFLPSCRFLESSFSVKKENVQPARIPQSAPSTFTDLSSGTSGPDGKLDAQFGSEGVFDASQLTDTVRISAIAHDSSGNIFVGGETNTRDVFVAKILSTGILDTNFGIAGKFVLNLGSRESLADLTVQPDGRILGVGQANYSGSSDIFFFRLNSNGTLDTSFSGVGRRMLNISLRDYPGKVRLTSSGKIVLAGYVHVGSETNGFLLQLLSNGEPDASFGTNGLVYLTGVGKPNEIFRTVAIARNGNIFAGGYAYNGTATVPLIAAYNPTGSLISSFGTNGVVLLTLPTSSEASVDAMGLDSQNRIVFAGTLFRVQNKDILLGRLLANGSVDSQFGTNGTTVSDFRARSIFCQEEVSHLLVLPNDAVVVVGTLSRASTTPDLFTVKYTAKGTLEEEYGVSGLTVVSLTDTNEWGLAAAFFDRGIVVGGSAAIVERTEEPLGSTPIRPTLARILTRVR